jgi:hypothetical protein
MILGSRPQVQDYGLENRLDARGFEGPSGTAEESRNSGVGPRQRNWRNAALMFDRRAGHVLFLAQR